MIFGSPVSEKKNYRKKIQWKTIPHVLIFCHWGWTLEPVSWISRSIEPNTSIQKEIDIPMRRLQVEEAQLSLPLVMLNQEGNRQNTSESCVKWWIRRERNRGIYRITVAKNHNKNKKERGQQKLNQLGVLNCVRLTFPSMKQWDVYRHTGFSV